MKNKPSLNPSELLTDFNRLYILTQLHQGPQYGYQLITQFRTNLQKNISPSAVYPFLKQLETNGYLTHTTTLIGERQRKTCQLTPKGQDFCQTLFQLFTAIFAPAIKAAQPV
ncbi:PadR family transcriptional regulator [Candidatus Bathycorpusculum sp.]|uniref:PadR family transcriptional regulator n=1 Tax=Candidatus Bathycorpusculum sp. TaxID=2994959 RepID=UPI002818C372|nr:PadR family transcriptional regulator [Candidatus Termitimicrobium sp.]